MGRPFIDRVRITNYGRIRDAEFGLTPIHAFIGPNDSGKSSILRAVETTCRAATGALPAALTNRLHALTAS